MFKRAARTEGKNPPIIPIITAKIIELNTIEDERLKLNDISENEPKFNVDTLKN